MLNAIVIGKKNDSSDFDKERIAMARAKVFPKRHSLWYSHVLYV